MSSWATRVRRDDLLTLQVDGTQASAIAGLHRCHVQSNVQTPDIAHFSVMKDLAIDYRGGWAQAPPLTSYPIHIASAGSSSSGMWRPARRWYRTSRPVCAMLRPAEICQRSMRERAWVAMPR